MTKMRLNLLAVIVALVAVGCEKSAENVTESGLAYNYITKGDGQEVADGQFLILNMAYTDDNDSAWMDTQKSGIPVPVMKQDSVWKTQGGSIEQVFSKLKKGDSITFNISVVDFFNGIPGGTIPPGVDSTGSFNFNIGVSDVLPQEEIMAWQQQMVEKQSKVQLDKDIAIIDDYLAENNIEAQETPSGLRYVVTQEGIGDNAQNGDTVFVSYIGNLLDGPIFDTSVMEIAKENDLFNPQRSYEPFKLALGTGSVIRGWDEGLSYLNKGSKATLYIPSTLGYGPRAASPVIGPNSILVFDVEMVDINK